MSKSRLAAALALTALTAAVPADAAPKAKVQTVTLTLSGQGNAYADVVLPRPLTVDTWLQGDASGHGFSGWSWQGCGSYRGYFLQPLGRGPAGLGAIDFAMLDFAPNPRRAMPLGGVGWNGSLVPAGATRIYLLAESACRLTVRLRGSGPSLSFATRHRAPVQIGSADLVALPHPAGAPARAGVAEWDVTITPDTFLVTIARSLARSLPAAVYAQSTVRCTDPVTRSIGEPLPTKENSESVGGESPNQTYRAVGWYPPRWLPPGTCTVRSVAGGANAEQAVAAFVAIDLADPARRARSPRCELVFASPAYAGDRTVACTSVDALFVSTDGGQSWQQPAASGLVVRPTVPPVPIRIAYSPAFATDRTLYAVTTAGLYASTDLGATFELVDPDVRDGAPHLLAPFLHRATTGTTAAFARPGWPGVILDPATRARTPAFVTPGGSHAVLVPPLFPGNGEAFTVVAADSVAGAYEYSRLAVAACLDELTCAERFLIPVTGGTWHVTEAWTAGGAVHFVLRGSFDGATAWRSLDGGRTFSAWSSLTHLLIRDDRRDLAPVDFALAWNATLPGLGYLRVSRTLRPSAIGAPADEALYRSDDHGTTWRQVAAGWSPARSPARGAIPWGGFADAAGPGTLELAADGTLFATGWVAGQRRLAVFRSTDGGRHWSEPPG